jgi:hypothetical protein
MKRIGLFACGVLLSVSPTFSMDECLYKCIDSFFTGKFIFWTESNDEKLQAKDLPEVNSNLKNKDKLSFQESILSVNSSNNTQEWFSRNKNIRAHFVGDVYGWCIAYY